MIRTHTAGSLRREHAGQSVTLAGWVARRRDHGGVVFIDLRDASGSAQVVFREEDHAHDLRSEYCVRIAGEVRLRPEGNENPDLPTGDIEVVASEVEVLSESAPLPFPIEGTTGVSEEARLKYRYLDIRRRQVAEALRIRSTATYLAHEVMREHGFLYVETPDLTRSTPEGARDFLVPVRLQPGSWYALPQSPQLFKQLLMVAGLERYYQLARCFRDEDLRADRQPEFTQIDVEMSFADQEDVMALGEALIGRLWRETAGYELPSPLPRLTYREAMDRYGSDKPDLRFGCELVDMTSYFAETTFRVFQAPYVGPWSCRVARRRPARSSTAGRSGPSPAARGASRTSWCSPAASSAARSPRTCRRPSARGWPPLWGPPRETRCSSPPATRTPRATCSARPGWRSAGAAG